MGSKCGTAPDRATGGLMAKLAALLAALLACGLFPAPPAAAQVSSPGGVVARIPVETEPMSVKVNPATRLAYVANFASDSISVINVDTNQVIETYRNSEGHFDFYGPCATGIDSARNRILVANNLYGCVAVIDGNDNCVVGKVGVGAYPWAIAVDEAAGRAYVACAGSNSVTVFDTFDLVVLATIPVGEWPTGIAVDPASASCGHTRIFVANSSSGTVSMINADTRTVEYTFPFGGYWLGDVVVNPTTHRTYISCTRDGLIRYIEQNGTTGSIGNPEAGGPGNAARLGLNTCNGALFASNSSSHSLSMWANPDDTGLFPCTIEGVSGAIGVDTQTGKIYVANADAGTVSVVVAPALDGPCSYFAEGTCRPGFDPYICLLNTDPYKAEVTITYMRGSCGPVGQSVTVPPHSRQTVNPVSLFGRPVPECPADAWDFSAKVDPAGRHVVVERPTYFNYNGWTGGHDVVGADSQGQRYYFAEGTTRAGFDSYICVLNPNAEEVWIRTTFMMGDGRVMSWDLKVAPLSRWTMNAAGYIGAEQDFSCLVECRTPEKNILAERPMYFNYRGLTGGSDVAGAAAPACGWYLAEGTTRPGFQEYICIQNPNSGATNVQITYMFPDGSRIGQSLVGLPANSRTTVDVNTAVGANRDVSAVVESSLPVVVERPMYFNYKPGILNWDGGHDVMGCPAPAVEFEFAEGTTRPGFQEYICLQNPGETTATVCITYLFPDGTQKDEWLQVGPASRRTVDVNQSAGPGLDVSALVKSDVPIVAERPMYFNYNGWTGGSDAVGHTPSN